LTHLNLLLPMQVKPSMLLLLLHQSSRDLAWLISWLLIPLVTQIPVRLVVSTRLFIILLCLHSLTHPCTLGQDRITPHQMITRRQGLKLLRTSIILFLMIVDKGGEQLGLKLQEVSQKVLGVERRISSTSAWDLYVFLLCLPQVGLTGMCDRSDQSRTSFNLLVYNIYPLSSLHLRKY
jgi:hypothetical protein